MRTAVLMKAAFLALLAGGSVAAAQTQMAISSPAGEEAMATSAADVLGLRLGMPAQAAVNSLRKQGFKPGASETETSFRARVGAVLKVPAAKRSPDALRSMVFSGANGEAATLGFVQTLRGPVVSSVQVQLPEQVSTETLAAALTAKYGPATCDKGWCAEFMDVSAAMASDDRPRFTADPTARKVELDGGRQWARLSGALLAEAVRECRRSYLGAPTNIAPRLCA
jgi:hypothetical protein